VGGNKIDTAISEYLRKHHNLSIGEHMAETVKHKIGRAIADDQQHSMQVQGRDIVGGLPKTITLADSEIIEPIQDILEQIVRHVRSVLENTQPELVSDIIDRGIVLTGGGGKLTGVDVLFKKVIDVPILIADDPEYCVVNGAAVALGNLAEYQKSLLSSG
jgi:rod shape-determining protein MreB